MAISRVTAQDCTASTGNNTTLTCSYPNTPTQGDLLISVCLLASGFSSVTTPSGYSVAFHEDCSNGAITVALAYKIAGAAESKNVTWSFSGSNGTINIDQHEYTGNVNSSPLDKTAVGRDGGSTEQTQATGTTATTTNANELVFTVMGWSGSVTSNTWTNATHSFTNNLLFTGERIVSSTGAYTDTANWTNNRLAFGGIATFIAFVAATPSSSGGAPGEIGNVTVAPNTTVLVGTSW